MSYEEERARLEVTVSEDEQKRRRAEAIEAARPTPSNVIPFPAERSKARPVVIGSMPIPASRINAAIELAAGYMSGWTVHQSVSIADRARKAVRFAFQDVFEGYPGGPHV